MNEENPSDSHFNITLLVQEIKQKHIVFLAAYLNTFEKVIDVTRCIRVGKIVRNTTLISLRKQ